MTDTDSAGSFGLQMLSRQMQVASVLMISDDAQALFQIIVFVVVVEMKECSPNLTSQSGRENQ